MLSTLKKIFFSSKTKNSQSKKNDNLKKRTNNYRQNKYQPRLKNNSLAKPHKEESIDDIKIEFVDTELSKPNNNWQVDHLPKKSNNQPLFFDFDLPQAILRALHENKFYYCTPIQEKTFQYTLTGSDLAGKAQTGTGKTVAFLVAALNHMIIKPLTKQKTGSPRCIIIAPTRELAIQISDEAKLIGKYCDINVATLYGGVKYEKQVKDLRNRVDILVGTPGRLTDCWRKKWVNLKNIEIVILDEADRMLDMGFIRDIQRLLVNMPLKKNRLTLFFSATYDEKIKKLLASFLKEGYHFIDIKTAEIVTEKINQTIYTIQKKDKLSVILWYLKNDNVNRMIIFVNRRDEAYNLNIQLESYGINLATLSSDIRQNKRQKTIIDFETGNLKVIVATDIMGRGIHINNISHIINYELPYEAEDYLHRIGRTGRAGKKGKAISFACEASGFELPVIEKYIGAKLTCENPLPEMLILPKVIKPIKKSYKR